MKQQAIIELDNVWKIYQVGDVKVEALRAHVDDSFYGPYTEINPRTVKYDKPIKV